MSSVPSSVPQAVSHCPFWLDTVSEADFFPPDLPRPRELPRRAYVAIIGGGIIGLSCARELTGMGAKDVVVLERGELLCEASGGNGGGLWPNEMACGAGPFHDLGTRSLEMLRRYSAERGPDLDHRRCGVLGLVRTEADLLERYAEYEQRRAAGLTVEWMDRDAVLAEEPALAPDEVYGALWYPEDDHINPAKLGAAYAVDAQRGGAAILTGMAVRGWEDHDHLLRLFTDEGAIDAAHVVVTAGSWASDFQDFLCVKVPVTPVRGQLLAASGAPPDLLRHAVFRPHGVIQNPGGVITTGGTVEHVGFNVAPEREVRERIWDDAVRLIPALKAATVTHHWARFRPHTPDELPVIGPCRDDRRLVAGGHYRNGLLLAPITGRIIAEMILHGECTSIPAELVAAVDPHRFGEDDR
jgi:glycine oxidase